MQAVRISAENIDASSTGRVLAAAEALFVLHGYGAVSMSAVAVHADISKANIFHHFSSENALSLAVLQAAC